MFSNARESASGPLLMDRSPFYLLVDGFAAARRSGVHSSLATTPSRENSARPPLRVNTMEGRARCSRRWGCQRLSNETARPNPADDHEQKTDQQRDLCN